MGEYVQAITVRADASWVFDYLAEVRHLPDYVSVVVAAEPTERAGEVSVVVVVDGVRRERTAWLRRDLAAGTMQWRSDGQNDHRGQLAVTCEGADTAVTVTLRTERADGPGIRAGLDQSLAQLKYQLDGRVAEPACCTGRSGGEDRAG